MLEFAQSLKLYLCMSMHGALQPVFSQMGSDLDDNNGTAIKNISNFGFYSEQH